MFGKSFSTLAVIGAVAFFLYFASYTNNPSKKNLNVDSLVFRSDVIGTNGMVSCASKYASEIGVDILKRGGNAIDAAVAMGFALAVTYPQAGNIGGGGFIVLRTKDSVVTSIDFREKAPLASTRDMFLDAQGNYLPDKSQYGHLSAGVPGSVAGLLYVLEKYGTMKRDDVLDPAINLAEDGFEIEDHYAYSLNSNSDLFNKYSSTKKVFTKSGKYKAGEKFLQKDLANTLKLIKAHGREGFYSGITADLIEAEMKNGSGIMTKEDLANYQPVERKAVTTNYKGYDVYSMGPPSSGGIALIQLLNMTEFLNIPDKNNSEDYANYLHYVIESMKRVYADRSQYLGDPDFFNVPKDLINKNYSKERVKQIQETASPSGEIKPGLESYYKESDQTTHVSVIDKDGNMVSFTTTLNNTYGSYVVVDGAGFFLNDEMDDFASKPGTPNMYGLVGSDANAIQPNKRMLSSMTPTIILKDGKPFMCVGSPGGGRIITSVFQTIINVIDFNMPISEAIDNPRFHHQWTPPYIQFEVRSFNYDINSRLNSKGHESKQISDFGRVEGIVVDWSKKNFYGHTDRRGNGMALGY